MRGIGKAGGRGRDLLSKPSMELPQRRGRRKGSGKTQIKNEKEKMGGRKSERKMKNKHDFRCSQISAPDPTMLVSESLVLPNS